eukprot:m.40852 g.40852  ORF g.40852 m.40852 type:complete len:156 (-) comp8140_c0_seq1:2540-3007(-)
MTLLGLFAAAATAVATLPAMEHYEHQAFMAMKMGELGSGRPDGVDPAFDCAWREYAYQYAVQIQPWLADDKTKMAELFDALQLGSLCKQSQANIRLNAPPFRRASWFHQSDAGVTVFVDAANGKDDQPMAPTAGSIGTPFKTVAAAIEFTREHRA